MPGISTPFHPSLTGDNPVKCSICCDRSVCNRSDENVIGSITDFDPIQNCTAVHLAKYSGRFWFAFKRENIRWTVRRLRLLLLPQFFFETFLTLLIPGVELSADLFQNLEMIGTLGLVAEFGIQL